VNVETEMFKKYENKNKLLLTKWRDLDKKARQTQPKQKFVNAVNKVIQYQIAPTDEISLIVPSTEVAYSRPGSEAFFDCVKSDRIE